MSDETWTRERIRRLRKSLGLSQSEFADALGIAQSRVSDLERGKIEAWGLLSRCLDYYSELRRIQRESPLVVDGNGTYGAKRA